MDENGVQARGEAAVGIPEFVMIKAGLYLTASDVINSQHLL